MMTLLQRFTAVFFAVTIAFTAKDSAADSADPLLTCRLITDASARLACFDRESERLAPSKAAASTTAPGSPASTTAAGAPAAPTSPAAPGSPAPTTAAEAPASPTSSAPPPPAPAPPATAAPLSPQQQFGLPKRAIEEREAASGTRPREVSKIEAHIVGLAVGMDGRLTLALDNEQVWVQSGTEADMLIKRGDEVTISRALFGSFWLQSASGRGCKVYRLK